MKNKLLLLLLLTISVSAAAYPNQYGMSVQKNTARRNMLIGIGCCVIGGTVCYTSFRTITNKADAYRAENDKLTVGNGMTQQQIDAEYADMQRRAWHDRNRYYRNEAIGSAFFLAGGAFITAAIIQYRRNSHVVATASFNRINIIYQF